MSFPAYPSLKDSGAEWLCEVPHHWKVAAIKWLSPVLRGASPRPIDDPVYFDDDGEYGWVRIADVTASKCGLLNQTTQKLSPLGASLSVKLEPGKLFLSIAGSVGKPCITGIRACIHDGFVYFPLLNVDQRLLYRIFELGSCFGGLGKMGTQLNLNTDTVGGIMIAIPPGRELQNILKFLDHETAKIDILIREQKRLIELLQEKRQAVISHAVTKGLDPNVPMKDSGVQWLGEVPEHWNVCPIKFLVATPVTDGPHETPQFLDDGILFVSAEAVSQGVINFDKARFISESDYLRYSKKYKPERNDIYMVKSGATTGVLAINESDKIFNIWSPLAVIRCSDRADPHFVLNAMRSQNFQESIILNWSFGTQQNIGMGVIENLPLAIPPISDQIQIRDYLSEVLQGWNSLEKEAKKAVELLKERRSALISAAVTGKIDVRDWQPPSDESAFDKEVLEVGLGVTA
jgi:type I restriction enzyme S subunit